MRNGVCRRLRTARAAAVAVLLCAGGIAHAFDSVDDDRLWAVTHIAVVDVETGEVRQDQTIVVRRGIIQSVGPASGAALPESALVVDERGRYAIPGLWDMHVHIRGGAKLEAANEQWLRQYLAFGVTAVREAGGDLPEAVLGFKARVAKGQIYGPRIFTSLQKLDGPDGAWAGSLPVASAQDAARALDKLQAAGADFIKVYDGSIAPDVYLETLKEAERRGLRTAAHIPLMVPFQDAIESGLDSVEHAFHLVKAANQNDRAASRRFAREGIPLDFEPFFVAVSKLGDSADDDRAREIFAEMKERHVALTPTLYIRRAWNRIRSELDGENDPRLKAVPPGIRATYTPVMEILAYRTADEIASDARLEEIAMRLTRVAAEEGVTILAGTDTGAENALAYPGDSLHRELETLVDLGLTPLRALQAATIEPARWFGKAAQLGSVAKGKAADFVILESDPLEDITQTGSIVAVVQQGVFFDRGELDDLAELPAAEANRPESTEGSSGN